MILRTQLRWGGLLIIGVALLMSGTSVLVYTGMQNVLIQATYGIGLAGLILACTMIHVTQARRAGVLGLLSYLVTVFSILYANVGAFLRLAELSGIEGIHPAFEGTWNTFIRFADAGVLVGLTLLGISAAFAQVLPRGAGMLVALGTFLQLPTRFALQLARPFELLFPITGSVLLGVGLGWIGWALWSGKEWTDEPGLSDLDRLWGAPFVVISGGLMAVNAYINSIPDLTLLDGIVNLMSITAMILAIVILHTAQADRAGGLGLAGFFLTHLGSTLLVITAYLIMAQLAGHIETNHALMASWVDIPVGRVGSSLQMLGTFLFGVSAIRAEVFPRGAGWLVAIGLALLLPSQFQSQDYLFSILWVIGAALQGLGLGWMGWGLWRKREVQSATSF